MLRNLSVIVFFAFVAFLTLGLQSRSSAQLAISSSWAGYTMDAPILFCNINGGPKATGGSTGTFAVGSTNWTLNGSISKIVNTIDSNNTLTSVVTARGAYYPIVNRVKSQTPTPVNITFIMNQTVAGYSTEGIWMTNSITGAYVNSTGMNRDGSLALMPLLQGSITITL